MERTLVELWQDDRGIWHAESGDWATWNKSLKVVLMLLEDHLMERPTDPAEWLASLEV